MINQGYKGAVFFDVDGTLVDEREKIYLPTEATKKAIDKLSRNGWLVGLSTGRSKCYIPDMEIDFNCCVSCNGAVAEIDNEVIFNDFIPPEETKQLIDFFEENDIAYDVETRDICYHGENRIELLHDMLKLFNIQTTAFTPYDKTITPKANKLMIVFDRDEQFAEIENALSGKCIITRHHQNNSADIMRRGMSKAEGVKAVIAAAGIDIKNTYAFGDDKNDVEMLSTVGCGIAMTPHSEALDSVAKMYTGSVKEDGISNALLSLGLI